MVAWAKAVADKPKINPNAMIDFVTFFKAFCLFQDLQGFKNLEGLG
jgi:hypothetical protein